MNDQEPSKLELPLAAAQRISETALRAFIDHSADLFLLLDQKAVIQYVSPAITPILGYTVDEQIGLNGLSLIHLDDQARAQELFKALLENPETSKTVEFRAHHKDGSWRWLEATGTNLLAEPSIRALVVNARDITDRKRVEEALQSSEELLNTAQQIAHMGSWELNLVTNHLTWSAEIYRIFEIDQQSFGASYEAFLNTIHPADRELVNQSYTASVENHSGYSVEHRLLMADGRIKYVHEQGETVYDQHGQPLRSIGTVQDITERKRGEAAAREQQYFIEQITNAIPDIVYVVDLQTKKNVFVNREMLATLGYSLEEIRAQKLNLLDLVHPDDALAVAQSSRQIVAIADGDLAEVEYRMKHADGSWRWLQTRHTVFKRDAVGNVVQFLGVAQNVTERKQAEEALRESESLVHSVIDSLQAQVVVLDRTGVILSVNEAWKRFALENDAEPTTLSPAGINYLSVCQKSADSGDELAGQVWRGIQQVLNGTLASFSLEYPCHSPLEQRWFVLTVLPLLRSSGGVVLSHENITERWLAVEALRDSEARNRAILEAMPDLMFRLDRHGVFLDYRAKRTDELYLPPEAIIGHNLAEGMPPDVVELTLRNIQLTLDSGQVQTFEYSLAYPTGPRYYEARMSVRSPNDVVTIARDITDRKQVEIELRKLSSVVVQTADAVLITDRAGKIEFANPAFEKLTGYSSKKALGQTPRILKSGQQSRRFYENMWRTILAGQVWRGVVINAKKNGEHYYEEKIITPLKNELGEITHFVSTSRDITEQKRIEAELDRHSRQLTALDQMARVVTASLELEVVLNRVIAETRPLLKAEGISVLLLENQKELVFAAVSGVGAEGLRQQRIPANVGVAGEAIQTGNSIRVRKSAERQLIYRDIEKSSGYHTQSLLAVPLALGKTIIGVMEAVHHKADAFSADDLSTLESAANWASIAIGNARQHTELQQRLKERETLAEINQTLTETLEPDRVLQLIAVSARRIIPTAARAVIHLLDEDQRMLNPITADGLNERGKPDLIFQPGQGIAGQVLAQGQAINIPDTQQDNRYVPLGLAIDLRSLLVAPVQSGSRRLGTISVQSVAPHAFSAEDEFLLTTLGVQAAIAIENARLYDDLKQALIERETAQAQLIHSEKMAALGRLIASLAHEINNPLQSVQSCLTLAEEEVDGALRIDKLRRYLQVAAAEIERIAALVRRMREFYRPTHGGMQPVDIQVVLQGVLELTAKQLQQSHVTVQSEWATDLSIIQANADHLKQVFLNLILNAIDAMPDGGTLIVRTRLDTLPPDGDQPARPAVRIDFADTGSGMPPEVQARLFEPFFTTKENGSGLGLSVSYGIIQAHGGQIDTVSQAHIGSTFSILLPINSGE
jgi:PAS domain S-box-containing protein